MDQIAVFLEIGQTRTFAGAIDWPGWCRSGRGEAAALQALIDYGPRYARAIRSARLNFSPPPHVTALKIVERQPGNATTDFGAPDAALASDELPVSDDELRRLQALLKASWKTFDSAAKAAAGRELSKGPRGGGRDLDAIVKHVVMAEVAYLGRLGVKVSATGEAAQAQPQVRQAALEGLELSAHGQIPARGPRGGLRWLPRRFVRRAAWHILDHAWEIEDRMATSSQTARPGDRAVSSVQLRE